ncbi:unnamed protein product [Urochloa decumbens]|uniref:Fe2OG dioxygenase domain-containing protein n=1 Tax=Urochloa decumbens TaxID=240449 RepID=A0ABC9GPT2_9POAL
MSGGRDEVRRAILDAGKEHGFFQVVGHGVPEQAIRDMEAVCHEFFEMPAADKAAFYSEDKAKPNRLFSGSSYETLGERYWRDCLRLVFPLPSGDTSGWPHKPLRLREVVANYAVLARGLAMEILRLLCEGMGLRRETTSMATSAAAVDLITVLLPGTIPGLEVAYNGDWIRVQPVPNSFVVNFGLQLEVVTNGTLKSVEHRAVTNSAAPRMSVAALIVPADGCVIGPAEEFVGDDNPPRYRTMSVGEFKRTHNVVNLGSSINQSIGVKIQEQPAEGDVKQ